MFDGHHRNPAVWQSWISFFNFLKSPVAQRSLNFNLQIKQPIETIDLNTTQWIYGRHYTVRRRLMYINE